MAGGNFEERLRARLEDNAGAWAPYNCVVFLGGFNDVHRHRECPSCVIATLSGSGSSSSRGSHSLVTITQSNAADVIGCCRLLQHSRSGLSV